MTTEVHRRVIEWARKDTLIVRIENTTDVLPARKRERLFSLSEQALGKLALNVELHPNQQEAIRIVSYSLLSL